MKEVIEVDYAQAELRIFKELTKKKPLWYKILRWVRELGVRVEWKVKKPIRE